MVLLEKTQLSSCVDACCVEVYSELETKPLLASQVLRLAPL